MLNKDNAFDMFNHFTLDQGCVMSGSAGNSDPSKYVEIKITKKSLKSIIRKLTILQQLGAVKGILYLRTMLKKI